MTEYVLLAPEAALEIFLQKVALEVGDMGSDGVDGDDLEESVNRVMAAAVEFQRVVSSQSRQRRPLPFLVASRAVTLAACALRYLMLAAREGAP